jgi:ATP-dependent Clp protease ATP-binding subunit ClpB
LFTPLGKSEIEKIVALQLNWVKKLVSEQQITLEATEEAIQLLSEKGYDPQFGARPVKRVIQKLVLNQLSKEILSGKVTTNSNILLDAFDDELVFRN